MTKNLLSSGHTACSGCGEALGACLAINAAGPNVIIANPTGCLEIFTSRYPQSAWEVPWIHSLFENAPAVGTGIRAALKALGRDDEAKVIVQGGDGAIADIGFGSLSGLLERGDDVLCICYDNEAYMNCLSTSTLVLTKEGLKKIVEVKVGDELYAFDQNTYGLVSKRCSGVFDNGKREVFELETLHHSIKATRNHPFLVLKRNGRRKKNEFIWKTLEEIKIGDQIVVLKNLETSESYKYKKIEEVKKGDYKVNKLNEINLPEYSSPHLMKYLGLYVGDGWVREERGEVGFALPEGTQARQVLVELHPQIFGSHIRTDNGYVYISSVNLAKFINSLGFGQGAKNKTTPGWVFTLPKQEKESFIEGLMLSDGYKINGSCRYVSSSYQLLRQLRLLLQTAGYRVGKIHWQKKKKGTKVVHRELLKDSEYGYICFSKRKQWNVKKYPFQYRYQNFLIENKYFETEAVKKIKFIGIEPTLDLRVEDEHNFIADGIVVHNTGVQRSGLTPFDARTTTTPSGNVSWGNPKPKKDLPQIAAAHHIPYVATATVAYPKDLEKKVKKALSFVGPKYIQIHVPCPLGWMHDPSLTIQIAKLAVQTGLYPIIEIENGELTNVRKIPSRKPVEEYLKLQGRFRHLLTEDGREQIKMIQAIADENVRRYGL